MLIVAIVLGLAFLTVLLLLIPIDLAFSYERQEGSRSRMRIGWLFGLIGKELGGERKRGEKKPKEKKAKKERKSFGGPLVIFRARSFSGRLFLLAKRLAKSVRVRDVEVEFQVGTGDPAETGQLHGLIVPVVALARSSLSPDIRVDPNFVEGPFRGDARGAVRVYPIKLIPPLIAFTLSPATFRGVRAIWSALNG